MANPSGPARFGVRRYTEFRFESATLLLIAGGAIIALAATVLGATLLYGGLAPRALRRKALESALAAAATAALCWALLGYSLAFAPNPGTKGIETDKLSDAEGTGDGRPYMGTSEFFALQNVTPMVGGQGPEYPTRRPRDSAPRLLWLTFHISIVAAAAIPLAVILASADVPIGLVALAAAAWGLVSQATIMHWVWGPGWLRAEKLLDHGGGLSIHVALAGAAVAAALVGLRPRRPDADAPESAAERHSADSGWPLLAGGVWCGAAMLIQQVVLRDKIDPQLSDNLINLVLAGAMGSIVWRIIDGGEGCGLEALSLGGVAGMAALSMPGGSVPPQIALITAFVGSAAAATLSRAAGLLQERRLPWLIAAVHGLPALIGGQGVVYLNSLDSALAACSAPLVMLQGIWSSFGAALLGGLVIFGVLKSALLIFKETTAS